MQSFSDNQKITEKVEAYYNQAISFLGKLIEYVDDIDAILKDVADFYDADRSYVFEFSDDRKTIDNTYEWCKDGIEPQIDLLQDVPYESVEAWVQEFKRIGAFFISSLDKDVDANTLTYEILEVQGIDSLITAPIFRNNEIIGFVGVDNPHKNTDSVVILKVTASIIYSEISRKIANKNKTIREITKAHEKQFAELGEIKDIIASADMGTWRIELVDNEEPRMYVDDTMRKLLGVENEEGSPEKTYTDWFSNVTDEAVPSVLKSVDLMKQGYNDENTYLWKHPTKGVRYVRCGGTSKKIPGGYSLQGYHYDVDEVVRREQKQMQELQYRTYIIDEQKKEQEKLLHKTQTDEMTGLLNRRAYEERIYEQNDIPKEDKFIYVSIDANGLKLINDTIGHAAGDEMLVGVAQCMKNSLGPYGHLYRIGGDEFIAILFCDDSEAKEVLADFDKNLENWSGKLVDRLSVSYGWINKHERPDASTRQLGAIAEARMYEAKTAYYKKQGVDRRGQQDAHKALCELYTKILRINVTDDSYQIINMDINEQTSEKGFADKISKWLSSFAKSGQVHPDDVEQYYRMTDLNFLKNYFMSHKTSLQIFYRRKYADGFKKVMMEIIRANDYSPENQSLFLYVKNIDL